MKAFSLIELMVVIAIVAILAAVAVPSYNTYIRKAKVDTTIQHINAVGDKVKHYYDTNGSFPTSVSQIGLPASFDSAPNSVSEYAIPPYIAAISIGGTPSAPGACAYFTVGPTISNLDNTGAFTAIDSSPQIGVQQIYVLTSSNVWTPFCYYYDISSTGDMITESILSNCYNVGVQLQADAMTAAFNALTGSCP